MRRDIGQRRQSPYSAPSGRGINSVSGLPGALPRANLFYPFGARGQYAQRDLVAHQSMGGFGSSAPARRAIDTMVKERTNFNLCKRRKIPYLQEKFLPVLPILQKYQTTAEIKKNGPLAFHHFELLLTSKPQRGARYQPRATPWEKR